MYIYIYLYSCVCVHVYVYIYIYRERERYIHVLAASAFSPSSFSPFSAMILFSWVVAGDVKTWLT